MINFRTSTTSLDCVRFLAAITVFLHHVNWLGLDGGGWLSWFRRDVGHSAVVVFFVLSGYVISAASVRDTGLTYAIKRASRVLSVAAPALLLTLAVDAFAQAYGLQTGWVDYEMRRPLVYFGFALTFTGDFWWLSVPTFSNNPFWSLKYEVWYYVVFGIAMFTRGPWRAVLLPAVVLMLGPKLWALFPIWLAGVALQRFGGRLAMRPGPARLLAAGALIVVLVLKFYNIEDIVSGDTALHGPSPLRFSQWFLGDYVVTLPFLALVHGLVYADLRFGPTMQRIIAAGAGISFSLYLVNYPLLSFFGAILPDIPAVLLTLAVSVAFGAVFEPQRHAIRRVLMAPFVPRPAGSGQAPFL